MITLSIVATVFFLCITFYSLTVNPSCIYAAKNMAELNQLKTKVKNAELFLFVGLLGFFTSLIIFSTLYIGA